MREPRFFLGLGLGALLGAAASVLLSNDPTADRSTPRARPVSEPDVVARAQPNSRAIGEVLDSDRAEVVPTPIAVVEQPAERDPVLLRDVFAALETAIGERPEFNGLPGSFHSKYVGLSDRDMLVAEYALRQRLESERSRIGAELLASGEGESALVRPGDTAPSMTKKPGVSVQSFAFSTETVGNDTLVKFVSIDTDRHPEFGALQEEWRWLVGHLRDSGLSLLRSSE